MAFRDDFWDAQGSGDSADGNVPSDSFWNTDTGSGEEDVPAYKPEDSDEGLPDHHWLGGGSSDELPEEFWEDHSSTPSVSKSRVSPLVKIVGVIAAIVSLLFGFLLNKRPATSMPEEPVGETTPVPDIFGEDPTAPVTTRPSQDTEPTTPIPPQTDVGQVRYFGQRLSPNYQKIYLQIVKAISLFDERVPNLILTRSEDINAIIEAVYWDYGGDMFWFDGGYKSTYTQHGSYVTMNLTPTYRWNKATCQQNADYVASATRDFLAQSAHLSEYEKAKAVYNYLVDNTVYDLKYTGKSVYEQFYYGRAVCDAYARSTQYLLNRLGVEVIYVVGDGYSASQKSWESHAWNIVKIDGQYYQFDSTWGDPMMADAEQTKLFTYLCVTTEEMARNHKANWSLYPNCTATKNNYYIREGYYLTSRDSEKIKAWMVQGAQNGNCFEFKAADASVYRWVTQELIQGGKIFDLFRSSIGFSGRYSYSCSDTFYTIHITWE